MRSLTHLDEHRVKFDGDWGDLHNGVFILPNPKGPELRVIAGCGLGWDHVSVSTQKRCPTWSEMQYIKTLFFHDEESAMQLHPPKAKYKNVHPYCLHIWRPHDTEIPLPPMEFV